MPNIIKILLLEDDPLDAELNIAMLEAEGYHCEWERVQTKKEFVAALEKPDYDLILADYNLPTFDGMTALALFMGYSLNIPFLLVSGNLGEDIAVEAIKSGATDYVLKDRLSRLGPSVRRALDESKLRKIEALRRADMALFRMLNQVANRGATVRELADILSDQTPVGLGKYGVSVYLLSAEKSYFETQNRTLSNDIVDKLEKFLGISIPDLYYLPVDTDSIYVQTVNSGEKRILKNQAEIEMLVYAYLDAAKISEKIKKRLRALVPKITSVLGIKSVVIFPLFSGQQCVGLLEFSHFDEFDADALHRIDMIGDQVTAIFSRKLAEEEVARLHREHMMILDSAGEGIFGLDTGGCFTFLNPLAAEMFGVKARDVLGKNNHQLHHHTRGNGKTYYLDECPIQDSFHDGEVRRVENDIFWRSDGSSFPVSYSSNPIMVGGILTGAVVTFRDISEQIEATREIARLAEVVKQASISVAITDLQGNLLYINPFFEQVSGFREEELVGQNPRILKSGYQEDAFYKELWETISSGGTWRGNFVNRRKDGNLYHEDASIFPITTQSGEIINYATVKREISAEIRASEQIKQQLSRLEALHMIDATISTSMDLALTIDVILKQAKKELGVDAVDLLTLNPALQSLSCAARLGFRTNALEFTHLRLGQGLAGQAALERKRVCIRNLEDSASLLASAPGLIEEGFVSYCGVPLIAKGHLLGVLEIFHRSQFDPDAEWVNFLDTLAGQAAIAIDNATLFDNLQRSNDELRLAYDTTLEGWAHALEMHDMETEDHSRRVTNMTTRLAAAMGFDEAALVHVRRGALLHDIGKMGIPDSILNKNGPLTDDEWVLMKKHPEYAHAMLADIPFLRSALDIPFSHHERWDGTGYPAGMKGDSIPLSARIFAVIDVYDALINDRSYRKAWTRKKALAYIQKQSGSHFDPDVVTIFFELFGDGND